MKWKNDPQPQTGQVEILTFFAILPRKCEGNVTVGLGWVTEKLRYQAYDRYGEGSWSLVCRWAGRQAPESAVHKP